MPSRTSTPTPGPLLPLPEQIVLGIVSLNDYVDELGVLHIVGEVRNDAPVNAAGARIQVVVYDLAGRAIHEISVSPLLDLIPAAGKAPFIVSLSRPTNMSSYSVRATAQGTRRQPTDGLEIIKSRAYTDQAGFYHVVGQVRNRGSQSVPYGRVNVVLYDPWGKVINVGFAYTTPRRLEPQDRADFDGVFAYYPGVDSYIVQAATD